MFKKKTDKDKKIKSNDTALKSPESNLSKKEDSKNTTPKKAKGLVRSVPVILCAIALFVTLCFITGETGAFGEFISSTLKGLFSYMAYTIPAFIVFHAIFFIHDIEHKKLLSRLLVSLVFLITLAEIAYIIPNISNELSLDASKFYNDGIQNIGGGFIGGVFGYGIQKIVGKAGLIIVIVLTIFLCGLFFVAGRSEQIYASFLKKLARIANNFAKAETARTEKKKRIAEAKEEKKRKVDTRKNVDFLNDDFFDTRNGISELKIPELGIEEVKEGAKGEAAFNLKDSVASDKAEKEPVQRIVSEYDIPITNNSDSKSNSSENYRADDIIVEQPLEEPSSSPDPFANISDSFASEPKKSTFYSRSSDDSAESIFSGSFDPYDIAVNEKLAVKRSSKADKIPSSRPSFNEEISEITPEYVERMARQAEFEARKQEALRRRTENIAAEAVVTNKTSDEDIIPSSDNTDKVIEKSETEEKFIPSEKPVESDITKSETTGATIGYHPKTSSYRYTTIAEVAEAYEDIKPRQSAMKSPSGAFRFVGETAKAPTFEAKEISKPTVQHVAPQIEVNVTTDPSPVVSNSSSSAPIHEEEKQKSNLVFETEEYKEPTTIYVEEEHSTLSISRSPLESEISTHSGLDFSFEEDDEDFEIGEPEEVFEKKEIPPEERNEKLYEYQKMFNIFSEGNQNSNSENDNAVSAAQISEEEIAEEIVSDEPTLADEEKEAFETESVIIEEKTEEDITESATEEYFSNEENIIAENEDDTDSSIEAMQEFENDASANNDTEADEEFYDIEDDENDVPFDIDDEEEIVQEKVRPDYSDYQFPPIDFLKKGVIENAEGINEEIQMSGDKLISTLDSFNIKATIRGIERGPRITRYSIVPARGVRVNQIEKRSDDIALALAAESIRIEAPIPGKAAVGVEVPNKISSIVSIRDLIESEDFNNDKSSTVVCIGKSIEGSNVFGDISSMPHLLIAGATGMGKSVCINSLITSILYKARPDEVKFIMIDPKKVEFAPYDGIPHLLVPVVTEVKQAAGVLMWAVDEMNKRYDVIQHAGVRTIDAFNEKIKLHPELGQFMSKIVIFIDELNDLMITVRDPVEGLITLIAQKARAAGIHLVIGTQRPSVNVITGVIKANIPSRIACKVSSGIDSRTILEQIGAEKLIGKGDMLFAPGGRPNPIRVQGAYVSDTETENIVNFIKAQAKGEIYDTEAMEDIRRAAQKCDKNKNGSDGDDDYDDDGVEGVGYLRDKKFLTAVEHAIRRGSIATSYLQRKLRIGYAKAAQYIDIMEDLGIVGEKDGSKPRDVLISMEEWMEKLSRLTDD